MSGQYDPAAIITGPDGTTAAVGPDGVYVEVRKSVLAAGAATEPTLASVLGRLDITLSALRDALRGVSAKTLTDLDTRLIAILAQLDVALSTRGSEATLATRAAATDVQAVRDRLPSALVSGRLAVEVGGSVLPSGAAEQATLASVLTQLQAINLDLDALATRATAAAQTDGSQRTQLVDGAGDVAGVYADGSLQTRAVDLRTILDYDGRTDGNPVYVGTNAQTALVAASTWWIKKLFYDANARLIDAQILVGAWSGRAALGWRMPGGD